MSLYIPCHKYLHRWAPLQYKTMCVLEDSCLHDVIITSYHNWTNLSFHKDTFSRHHEGTDHTHHCDRSTGSDVDHMTAAHHKPIVHTCSCTAIQTNLYFCTCIYITILDHDSVHNNT